MTPPPAATPVAAPSSIGVPRRSSLGEAIAGANGRLLQPRAWARFRVVVDLMVLYLASSVTLFAAAPMRAIPADRWLAAIFPLVVLVMMHARRTPDEGLNGSLLDTGAHVLGVVSLAAMLTVAVDSILGGAHPLALALRLWLFAAIYLAIARTLLLSVRRRAMSSEAHATPTLIVGAGVIGSHLVKRLVGEPRYGLRPVGFLDSDPLPGTQPETGPSIPVLGGPEDLAAAIETTGARHVILAFSSERDQVLVAKVRQCQQLGVDVSLIPRLYESINERTTLDHVGGLPLLSIHAIDPRGWQFALKHAIDRSTAVLALVVAAPVLVATANVIR